MAAFYDAGRHEEGIDSGGRHMLKIYEGVSTESTLEEGDMSRATQQFHDEAPIPFSVTIPRAEVVNSGAWLTHMSYLVQFSDMGLVRTVRRRFSDFQRLAQDLDHLLSHPCAHVLCATSPRPPAGPRRTQKSNQTPGLALLRPAGGDSPAPSGPWGYLGAKTPAVSPPSQSETHECQGTGESCGANASFCERDSEDEACDTHRSPSFPFLVSAGEQPVRFLSVEQGDGVGPLTSDGSLNPFLASQFPSHPGLGNGYSGSCASPCRGECAAKGSIVSVLPPKRLFGNMDPAFVEERRRELERFLHLLLLREEVFLLSPFWNFFEADHASALLASFFILTAPARRRSGRHDSTALGVLQETLWRLRELVCGALRDEAERLSRLRDIREGDGGAAVENASTRTQSEWLYPDPGDRGWPVSALDSSSIRPCPNTHGGVPLSSWREGKGMRCHLGENASLSEPPPTSCQDFSDSSAARTPNTSEHLQADARGNRDTPGGARGRVILPVGRGEAELWRLCHPQFVLRLLCMIADGPYLPAYVQLQVVDLLCLLLSLSPPCLLPLLVQAHAFELVFRLLEYTAASVNAEISRDLSRSQSFRKQSSRASTSSLGTQRPCAQEERGLTSCSFRQRREASASGASSSSERESDNMHRRRETDRESSEEPAEEVAFRPAARKPRYVERLGRRLRRRAHRHATPSAPFVCAREEGNGQGDGQTVDCDEHLRVRIEVADACMRLGARLVELCPDEFFFFLKSKEGLLRLRDLLRQKMQKRPARNRSHYRETSRDSRRGHSEERRRHRASSLSSGRRQPSQSYSRELSEADDPGRVGAEGEVVEGERAGRSRGSAERRGRRERQGDAAFHGMDGSQVHRQTALPENDGTDEADTDATGDEAANDSESSSNASLESYLSEEQEDLSSASPLLSALRRRAARRMLLCMLPVSAVPGDRTLRVAAAGQSARQEARRRRGQRRSCRAASPSSVSSCSRDWDGRSDAERTAASARLRGEEAICQDGDTVPRRSSKEHASRFERRPVFHGSRPASPHWNVHAHAAASCGVWDPSGSASSRCSAFSCSRSVSSSSRVAREGLRLSGAMCPAGAGGRARSRGSENRVEGCTPEDDSLSPMRQRGALRLPKEALRRAFKGRLHCFVAFLLWISLPLVGVGRALTSPQSLGLEILSLLYKSRHDTSSRILCALLLASLLRSCDSSFFAEDGGRRARLQQLLSHSLPRKPTFLSFAPLGLAESPQVASPAASPSRPRASRGDTLDAGHGTKKDVHARAQQAAEAIGTLPLLLVTRALRQPAEAELPSRGVSSGLLFYILSRPMAPRLLPLLSLSSSSSRPGSSPLLSPSEKAGSCSSPASAVSPSGVQQEETREIRAACEMEICLFVCWLLGILVSQGNPVYACLKREAEREDGEKRVLGDTGACRQPDRPSLVICRKPRSLSSFASAFTPASSSHIPASQSSTEVAYVPGASPSRPRGRDAAVLASALSPGDRRAVPSPSRRSPGDFPEPLHRNPLLPETQPQPRVESAESAARLAGADRESQKSTSSRAPGDSRRLRPSSQTLPGRGGLPFLSSLLPAFFAPVAPPASACSGNLPAELPVSSSCALDSLPHRSYFSLLLSCRRFIPLLFRLLQRSPSLTLQRLVAFVLLWLPEWHAHAFDGESAETGEGRLVPGASGGGRDARAASGDGGRQFPENASGGTREGGEIRKRRAADEGEGERWGRKRENGEGQEAEERFEQRHHTVDQPDAVLGEDASAPREWEGDDERKARLHGRRTRSSSPAERIEEPRETSQTLNGSSASFSFPVSVSSSSQREARVDGRQEDKARHAEENAARRTSPSAFSCPDISLLRGRVTACLLLMQQVQEEGDAQTRRLEREKKALQSLEELVSGRRSPLRRWGPACEGRGAAIQRHLRGRGKTEGPRSEAQTRDRSEDGREEASVHAQSCERSPNLHISAAPLDPSSSGVSFSRLPDASSPQARDAPGAENEEGLSEEKRGRREGRGKRFERNGEEEVWALFQKLGALRRTRTEMKRQTRHAVDFLTTTRGKLESLHLYASSVEHLCTSKILPLSGALAAMDEGHCRLSLSLAEKARKEEETKRAVQRQGEQELVALKLLQACTERTTAAKREAMRTRNEWMEVEQLIAAAPQRRQQLEEQVDYRMQILNRLREKHAEEKLRLQQLRLENQRLTQQRTQDEAEVRQIAAALEAYTDALNRRQESRAAEAPSAPGPALSSHPPAAVCGNAQSEEDSRWPPLTPFVRLLPPRLQTLPDLLHLVSVSEGHQGRTPPSPNASSSGWSPSRGESCLRFLRLLEHLLATRRDKLGEGEEGEEARYHEALSLEEHVESAAREIESHERQLDRLRASISEQTNHTSLLKKAETRQADVRRCDAEVSRLVEEEQAARRRHVKEKEAHAKARAALLVEADARRGAAASLEDHERQSAAQKEQMNLFLCRGEHELRLLFILLQRIEENLGLMKKERRRIEAALKEERRSRGSLVAQIHRTTSQLSGLCAHLERIDGDEYVAAI
ncbi:putative PX domain-containing protein [Neospora caninum Liverpool]|uniref:PX domain-containing protein, putative n=1 Tax=Neospora caninum (strain Liverpool) TaxID=572307 RepID=F0VGA5_NEOCL|nr:putative PX domain-containing protein [Neospora caninum Liverpool]CBZ52749.1 putative PX domain-containing protein [Neospora caninum Liverpool]CEL66730.1 TPA: PX domain-containing protein, putative [Neospora caninum Liverpool]|eukprot:XP_003882781.1 putative PX domain-containing protein [Neospora caninum Liverpool]